MYIYGRIGDDNGVKLLRMQTNYVYDYKPSSDLVYKLDTTSMVWSSINTTGTRASIAISHSA